MTRNAASDYGFARARDQAYDAVMRLWDLRKKEGFTQAQLAAAIGRDRGWVSRHLRGPGNWTIKTVGAFVVGLNGELEIAAHPLEEPIHPATNYDAYREYDQLEDKPKITIAQMASQPVPETKQPIPISQHSDLLKRLIEGFPRVAS